MSGQLTAYADPIVSSLEDLQRQLGQFAAAGRAEQQRLQANARALIANAAGLTSFFGQGADAFLAAVTECNGAIEERMLAVDDAVTAVRLCVNDLVSSCERADAHGLDADIVGTVLANLSHDDLAQRGGDAVNAVLQDLRNTLIDMAKRAKGFLSDVSHFNVWGALGDLGGMAGDVFHAASDGWELLGDLPQILIQWGWDIWQGLQRLGQSLTDFAIQKLSQATDWTLARLGQVKIWATNELRQFEGWASNEAQQVEGWASSELSQVEGWFGDAEQWVVYQAVNADLWLARQFHNVENWLAQQWNKIREAWSHLLSFVIPPPPNPLPVPADKASPKAVQAANDFHQDPNLQTLFAMIYSQYGTGAPIGVTQIGSNRILVTLSGTENKWNQTNNWATALDSGGGDINNVYEQDVYAAIEAYINEHHLTPPINVVVAGHSLGGMVAQDLALAGGGGEFNVANVISYGSPQVGPQVPGVQYQEYFNQYDPVPLVSWYENQAYAQQNGLLATLKHLYQINTGPWENKAAFTGERYVPDVGHYSKFSEWFSKDHHDYLYSTWLGQRAVPFPINQWGPTQYYTTTPQKASADIIKAAGTLGPDLGSALPASGWSVIKELKHLLP
ncbi:MAG TPA: hypothetical protein VKQ36_17230 [Ktedonobacterales bacterium]|nr:hypothetical protein [Ktedonobacterales bacterium]